MHRRIVLTDAATHISRIWRKWIPLKLSGKLPLPTIPLWYHFAPKIARTKQPLCSNLPQTAAFYIQIAVSDTSPTNSSRLQFDSRLISRPAQLRNQPAGIPSAAAARAASSSAPARRPAARRRRRRRRNRTHQSPESARRRNKPTSGSQIEFQRESDVLARLGVSGWRQWEALLWHWPTTGREASQGGWLGGGRTGSTTTTRWSNDGTRYWYTVVWGNI